MNYIFAVILFILWLISFFALRSFIKKRTSKETLLADYIDDVRDLEMEINRITLRDMDSIEERVAQLRALLKEAEEKTAGFKIVIKDLDKARRKLKEEEEKAGAAKKELETAQKSYGEKPLELKIEDLRRKGFSPAQIARKLDKTAGEIEAALRFADADN